MKIAGLSYKKIGDALGFTRQRAQQLIQAGKTILKQSGKCNRCGSTRGLFHCHHVDYRNDDFELLCRSCHGKEHARQRRGGCASRRGVF